MNQSILFSVLRAGMGIESSPPEISEEAFHQLLSFSRRQSVFPIVLTGLQQSHAPERWMESLQKEKLQYVKRYLSRDIATSQLFHVLETGEIPYIPLKGAVLQGLYPEPWLRTCHDIDVLVPQERLEDAVSRIEAETGFQVLKRGYHDVNMTDGRQLLELHFSLKENNIRLDPLLQDAWKYAVPADGSYRYCFTPEYQFFYITAHMSHHFVHSGLGVRPFIDLWLLRHKCVCDWSLVEQLCARCGIQTFLQAACALSEVWFGAQQHTALTLRLEEACLTGGVFGSSHFGNAVRQSRHRGLAYIASRILPPSYQVREWYQTSAEDRHSILYYHLKRWKRWFSQGHRQELRSQIQDLHKADAESIDSTRALLAQLDLLTML